MKLRKLTLAIIATISLIGAFVFDATQTQAKPVTSQTVELVNIYKHNKNGYDYVKTVKVNKGAKVWQAKQVKDVTKKGGVYQLEPRIANADTNNTVKWLTPIVAGY